MTFLTRVQSATLCGLALLAAPLPAQQKNPFDTVAPPPAQAPIAATTIEDIQFRGARRIPADTLRTMIASRRGDAFNADTLKRDFTTLWNTNRFDDIKIERETGERGGIVIRFVVTERPVVGAVDPG